jgi:hypothetical protein
MLLMLMNVSSCLAHTPGFISSGLQLPMVQRCMQLAHLPLQLLRDPLHVRCPPVHCSRFLVLSHSSQMLAVLETLAYNSPAEY